MAARVFSEEEGAMGIDTGVVEGREAYARRAWGTAYDRLRACDIGGLSPADLGLLAVAAYMVGDRDTATAALEGSFHQHADAGNALAAARDAHWLGYVFSANGNPAVGAGWVARGARLLADQPDDCVERGYLRIHEMIPLVYAGRFAEALEVATQLLEIGQRWGEPDLVTFGMASSGRLLLYAGRVPEGLTLLDEAMLGVTSGEVSPILTGEILCLMIEACQEVADYGRITEWTGVLSRWCDAQPDLVPFTGQCAVHRAQVLRASGDFPLALTELARARERYAANGSPPATGLALYEQGEIQRIQGEYAAAETAFAQARTHGHEAQPGLSLLWLARGRTAAAAASMRRLLSEAHDPVTRAQLLPAAVEVLLAHGDRDGARAAAEELKETADSFACDGLSARAAYAVGLVALDADDPAGALAPLRRAWKIWIDRGGRFEAARARVRIGLAYRALGDEDSAQSELTVAQRAFVELGARPSQHEVERLLARDLPDGLTAREVEVLRLVAQGQSNPQIASALFLSQKTVQRHLSNIFTKIGVTSRTAAGVYASEHELA